MKRLIFLSLLFAAVPLFAGGASFIYYNYGYDGYGYYDEYWYDDYWYDGYWVYMPYGYYCVHYVWWYPWWWDWYWARCHWCHNWSWHFFYAGFYVVWYDGGNWWFRPRYGRYVRYRLPYSYSMIRVRARTQGIYLPEKPPREIDIPYKQSQVMELTKQHDPELYARVEKEQRSGNLEKMRQEHVKQVNKEIALKNQEHGIKNNNIDIDKLSKQTKPVTTTKKTGTQRIQQQSKTATPRVENKSPAKNVPSTNTPSRIQKTSKTETKTRTQSPVRSSERVEQTTSRERNAPEKRVVQPRETGSGEKAIPKQSKEKQNVPEQKERKSSTQVQRQQERRPPQSRQNPYERNNQRENKR
jgi:hypothetical protein